MPRNIPGIATCGAYFAGGAFILDSASPHAAKVFKSWTPCTHGYLFWLVKEHGARVMPGAGIGIITVHAEAHRQLVNEFFVTDELVAAILRDYSEEHTMSLKAASAARFEVDEQDDHDKLVAHSLLFARQIWAPF